MARAFEGFSGSAPNERFFDAHSRWVDETVVNQGLGQQHRFLVHSVTALRAGRRSRKQVETEKASDLP
jgi:hypothetical protein